MIKKLCILILSVCTVAPLMAQRHSKVDASFAPKKGQWQVSAVIGNSQMFDQDMNYLLPKYYTGGDNYANFDQPIGLPSYNGDMSQSVTNNQSGDPGMFLNLGNLNSNNLVNLIGIQGKYFLTDRWDVNLMFSMNINATPSKDFIEGDHEVTELPIQDAKYLEGRIENAWTVAMGSNYYFNTKNERINLYVGGVLGWQMGRITTASPYTGETYIPSDETTSGSNVDIPDYPGNLPSGPDGDLGDQNQDGSWDGNVGITNPGTEDVEVDIQVYVPNSRAGQIFGLRVGAVAGIEYSVAKGLVFGFEVQPVSYRYDHIQICPKGSAAYKVGHHSIGLFATPNLKIGFRF